VWNRPYRFEKIKSTTLTTTSPKTLTTKQKFALICALIFLMVWVLFPLRHHFLYEGDVVWNEQGHNFSWRMKLRDKQVFFFPFLLLCFLSYSHISFIQCGCDVFGFQPQHRFAFSVDYTEFILPRDWKKAVSRPWMLIQAAHMIADTLTINNSRPEIYIPVRFISLSLSVVLRTENKMGNVLDSVCVL
jgi:hypothetical protein